MQVRGWIRSWGWRVCGALAVGLTGCVGSSPPLETVPRVDVERYVGKWYEIARYPAPFQEGCTGVTAEYTLLDNGKVGVVNTCRQDSLDGPTRSVQGTARVVDSQSNAKLKVTFFWPFEGDYWIIQLADDYSYAVVGEPQRRFLWILSRTPALPESTYEQILARVSEQGYDPTRLERTAQLPRP